MTTHAGLFQRPLLSGIWVHREGAEAGRQTRDSHRRVYRPAGTMTTHDDCPIGRCCPLCGYIVKALRWAGKRETAIAASTDRPAR